MDEDKSGNSADENKWGARLFIVRMTHRIQTLRQSIIQSCYKQMGKRTAVCFNWLHMRYQARSPFKSVRMLLSVQFSKMTWTDRSPQGHKQTPTWLSCVWCSPSVYTENNTCLLHAAMKQSVCAPWNNPADLPPSVTVCHWIRFYDSRGYYKNTDGVRTRIRYRRYCQTD